MLEDERKEYNQLADQNNYKLDMQDLKHKLYYQEVMEKQNNRLRVHESKVTEIEKLRENHISSFIENRIEKAGKKAEEEEIKRRLQKREQSYKMGEYLKLALREQQNEKLKQKRAYQDKIQDLKLQEKQAEELNRDMKIYNMYQMENYKDSLQAQEKETKEAKQKRELEMSDQEKKLNMKGINTHMNAQMRSMPASPQNFSSINQNKSIYRLENDSIASPKYINSHLTGDTDQHIKSTYTDGKSDNSGLSSPKFLNNWKSSQHNPIINPIPCNVQNPYILKAMLKDSSQYKLKDILPYSI